jgi:hypothetical protein
MLPADVNQLLYTTRPDVATWTALCRVLDATTLSPQQLGEVKKALSSWPREVPRRAPKEWLACEKHPPTVAKLLLSLCLDVTETEQLYNYYIGVISTSLRLRLRDGSPAVTMWRQLRGRVQLQNGTSIELGAGQPGLADLGGIMTVEYDKPLHRMTLPPLADRRGCTFVGNDAIIVVDPAPTYRLNLYVEGEIKTCGNIPPGAREYTGDSKRKLTPTERDQITRQQAQLARGGFYAFADRTEELVDALVRYRDDVVARMS